MPPGDVAPSITEAAAAGIGDLSPPLGLERRVANSGGDDMADGEHVETAGIMADPHVLAGGLRARAKYGDRWTEWTPRVGMRGAEERDGRNAEQSGQMSDAGIAADVCRGRQQGTRKLDRRDRPNHRTGPFHGGYVRGVGGAFDNVYGEARRGEPLRHFGEESGRSTFPRGSRAGMEKNRAFCPAAGGRRTGGAGLACAGNVNRSDAPRATPLSRDPD